MELKTEYEITCRECDFRKVVPPGDVYRAVKAGSETGHKLTVSLVEN